MNPSMPGFSRPPQGLAGRSSDVLNEQGTAFPYLEYSARGREPIHFRQFQVLSTATEGNVQQMPVSQYVPGLADTSFKVARKVPNWLDFTNTSDPNSFAAPSSYPSYIPSSYNPVYKCPACNVGPCMCVANSMDSFESMNLQMERLNLENHPNLEILFYMTREDHERYVQNLLYQPMVAFPYTVVTQIGIVNGGIYEDLDKIHIGLHNMLLSNTHPNVKTAAKDFRYVHSPSRAIFPKYDTFTCIIDFTRILDELRLLSRRNTLPRNNEDSNIDVSISGEAACEENICPEVASEAATNADLKPMDAAATGGGPVQCDEVAALTAEVENSSEFSDTISDSAISGAAGGDIGTNGDGIVPQPTARDGGNIDDESASNTDLKEPTTDELKKSMVLSNKHLFGRIRKQADVVAKRLHNMDLLTFLFCLEETKGNVDIASSLSHYYQWALTLVLGEPFKACLIFEKESTPKLLTGEISARELMSILEQNDLVDVDRFARRMSFDHFSHLVIELSNCNYFAIDWSEALRFAATVDAAACLDAMIVRGRIVRYLGN